MLAIFNLIRRIADTAMDSHDLNFLYLVDALYRERSVSRAALRLNLTQSAVSHGLNRLRAKFDDSLFVRTAAGMAPTPLGERIALGARRALELIQMEILDEPQFEPLRARHTFVVGMTDMGGTVILPRVVQALSVRAPQMRIVPVALRPHEVNEMMQSGAVDMAWGFFGHLSPALYQQTLFRRPLIGIRRKTRDGAQEVGMDFEAFVNRPHVFATATSVTNELLMQKVKERGATLQVALECPYILAVPAIIASSDYLATVPDQLASLFLRLADIETFSLPLEIPDVIVKQHWHARNNDDVAHRWMRSFVAECFAAGAPEAKF